MKKRIAALMFALVLAMGLPAMAFAAEFSSPSGTTVTGSNGTSATISGGDFSNGGYVTVEDVLVSDKVASNAPADANIVASFEVLAHGNATVDAKHPATLTINVGSYYAGATATVYIEHGDGTTETQTVIVAADGTISITVTKLSVFTIAVDESTIGQYGQGNQGGQGAPAGEVSNGGTAEVPATAVDNAAKSPQTGLGMGAVAGVTAIALAGAAVAAVALRKQLAK